MPVSALVSNSSVSPEPLWIRYNRDEELQPEWLLPAWRQCLDARLTSIWELHPQLLQAVSAPVPPLVYARSTLNADRQPALACLAAFAPYAMHVNLRAKLPRFLKMKGLRVAGGEVLGDGDQASLTSFVEDLSRWLRSCRGGPEFIDFGHVEVDSPLWNALTGLSQRGVKLCFTNVKQRYWKIRFPDNPQDYWKRFSGKTWYDIRYKVRKLSHTLRCYTQESEVGDFLVKAHEVSLRSWQAKEVGLPIRNDAAERAVLTSLASRKAMRCYVLEHEDKPVAFELGIQWRGRLHLEKTAYDTAYAQQSPGMVLFKRMMDDLLERDTPEVCDFGFGNFKYKEIFATEYSHSQPVALLRRSTRPMTALRLYQLGSFLLRNSKRAGRAFSRLRALATKKGAKG